MAEPRYDNVMRLAFALVCLLVFGGAVAAQAAVPDAAPGATASTTPAYAGADVPTARKELDKLFSQLAMAASSDEAKPVETQILNVFLQSGSPSVDLLMDHAAKALDAGDIATARQLFESITAIAPDFAEGWHQRARVEQVAGNDQAAMLSLQKAVMLNPHEFQAFAELGSMLEDYGDKSGALSMFRKALALDPTLDEVARHVRELTRAVEGQRI